MANVEWWQEKTEVREEKRKQRDRKGDEVGDKVVRDGFSVEVAFEQRPHWGEEASSKSLRIEEQGGWCAWSPVDKWEMLGKGVREVSQETWWTQVILIILIWVLRHEVVDKCFWIISSSKLKSAPQRCQVLIPGTSKYHHLKKRGLCRCYQGSWDGGLLSDYLGEP